MARKFFGCESIDACFAGYDSSFVFFEDANGWSISVKFDPIVTLSGNIYDYTQYQLDAIPESYFSGESLGEGIKAYVVDLFYRKEGEKTPPYTKEIHNFLLNHVRPIYAKFFPNIPLYDKFILKEDSGEYLTGCVLAKDDCKRTFVPAEPIKLVKTVGAFIPQSNTN